MSALPSYRQYLLLSDLPGWRSTAEDLTLQASGAYCLDALAGLGAVVAPDDRDPPAPVALAAGRDGTVYALDASMRIYRIPLEGLPPKADPRLPGVGGPGHDARRFRRATDLAVLPGGGITVADAGDRSVKVFSGFPYALLAVWRDIGRPSRLAPGAHGRMWVLDAEGQRVVGLDADGVVHTTLDGLLAPVALATSEGGDLAVLDGQTLRLFAPSGAPVAAIAVVAGGTALAFAGDDAVFLGASGGLVQSVLRDAAGTWREAGIGVLGMAADILAMAWTGGTTLLAAVRPEGDATASLSRIDTQAARKRIGTLTTLDLDSGTIDCVWHRIALDADIPAGASITVASETFATAGGACPPDLVPAPIVLAGAARDCLVQGPPGQFLRVTLTFKGDGLATPVLRGIRIWSPRDSWLQYLPAVYQEDAESRSFIERFLAILQTDFEALDRRIDDIWTLFDPNGVPASAFNWLAAWLALPIEPTWTDAQRRAVLKNAYVQYGKRGTAAGLQQVIADYTGVPARLVEHFKLRGLLVLSDGAADQPSGPGMGMRLWGRDAYARLQVGRYATVGHIRIQGEPEPAMEPLTWGAHAFSVFFDAEPMTAAATQKKVAAVVEREKPAHTAATYRPVYPRFRVGVQSTLGVDTRVGTPGQAVLGQISTLGYDAVLAPSVIETAIQADGAAAIPRLGIISRLH